MLLLTILLTFLAQALSCVEAGNISSKDLSHPIVKTPNGFLRGTTAVSRSGNVFKQFLGVRFARVPGRFELSVPVKAWEGIRLADTFGRGCDVQEEPEDEDCLNLNIFVPDVVMAANKLPVVVYIHGGAFQVGSNKQYGPNYFMDEKVILVVIQYRLSIFGFLSTGDEAAPGNLGLKDQVMALRWVQKNIESFGGNKNLVTIMGESAGGVSVTTHLVSPMSRGLFHRAIAQSGTFLDSWAMARNPSLLARKLGSQLGCPIKPSHKLIRCLKTVPLSKLTDYCLKRRVTLKWHFDPLAPFGPVIEPDGESAFLSSNPYEQLQSGKLSNRVPLLIGINKEEGVYSWAYDIIYGSGLKPCNEPGTTNHPWLHELRTNWTGKAPLAFYYDGSVTKERKDSVSREVRDFYFGPGGEIGKKSFYNLSHLYTDRFFGNSAQKFITEYSKHAPTYPYLYTFNKYWALAFGDKDLRPIEATHEAELDMLFSPLQGRTRNTKVQNRVSRNVVKLWTSFMRDGWPSKTYGSAKVFPKHDRMDNIGKLKWYQIDSDTSILKNIFYERFKFWKSLKLEDYP